MVYLKVKTNCRSCHQVVEMFMEILVEDVLRQSLVGIERLLLKTQEIELTLTHRLGQFY